MKLTLTLEADSVNVQALNMGRIVVDVDGIDPAELNNKVAENGYSLRVVDDSRTADNRLSTTVYCPYRHTFVAVPHISRKRTTPGCTHCHIRRMTSANQNGFILQVPVICYVLMRGRIRFCGLNVLACQKRSVVWLSLSSGVMASVSFIWLPVQDVCRACPLSTGN